MTYLVFNFLSKTRNSKVVSLQLTYRKDQNACEKKGFFQVINHGISTHVLDEMIKGTCRFHQQDVMVRTEYYTRDPSMKVVYVSN
jgi:isopenicillin N synthase-like dioxygenase